MNAADRPVEKTEIEKKIYELHDEINKMKDIDHSLKMLKMLNGIRIEAKKDDEYIKDLVSE